MADGHVEGSRCARRRPRIPSSDAVDLNRNRPKESLNPRSGFPGKWVLRDSDRRQAEFDAGETSEAEQRGMQSSMSVDEYEIGLPSDSLECGSHGREFAERQVRGDVREVDRDLASGDLEDFEGLRIEARRCGEGSLPDVGYVDARNDSGGRGFVVLADRRREP